MQHQQNQHYQQQQNYQQQGYQQQGYQQPMNNGRQPLDQGRVVFIAEKYQSRDIDPQTNQPKVKNRYATVGRATKWPKDGGGENIQIQIDTVPLGHTGSLELFIFWDSEQQGPR